MTKHSFRKATPGDIPAIMAICDSARRFMRLNGNMTQWVNGYPSAEIILRDINQGTSYLCVDSEGEILCTFAFIIGDDPTYSEISGGNWINDEPYGTIHRMASSGKKRGMLEAVTEFCFGKTGNIRLDTHVDNKPMLEAATRIGFIRCGVIICQDGTPREAFHLKRTE